MAENDSQSFEALTAALHQLRQKQEILEKRVADLESLQHANRVEPAPPPMPIFAEPPPPPPIARVEPDTAVSSNIEEGVPPSELGETADAPPPMPVRESGLESKVGLTLVNRIGAITLVLGVAFFFKWAVDSNWIGPAGRVILGLLAGFATLGAGDFLWRRKQQVFAQGITATGIGIIYLSLYAAFDFYQLIPQSAAFVLMVAATAMAGVLALRYNSLAIAALSLVGGYLTPILLSTGEDHPWFLFSYLLLLNFAATELAKRGGWPKLELISFGATTLIYGGWLFTHGHKAGNKLVATLALLAFAAQRWRTETPILFAFSQLLSAFALSYVWAPQEPAFLFISLLLTVAALAFAQARNYRLAVISAFVGFWFAYAVHFFDKREPMTQLFGITCGFALFLAWTYWHLVVKKAQPTTLALSVFALNGVIYYARAYQLLERPFITDYTSSVNASQLVLIDYHLWRGPLAALVAGVYLAFGLFMHRRSEETGSDKRPVLLALGVALAFLTLAIPIQFTGFTITIAWAIQGAALTWIASRLNSRNGLIGALAIFFLVALRLMAFESEMLPDPATYSLLWNVRFFTFAASAIAMLLSAYWATKITRAGALPPYFAGHIFMLWGLCLEILAWAARAASPENRLSAETIAISLLFGVYAVILVSAGVATRTAINRLTGLGLFGIVVLKLYFFDVWQLGRPYQIAAFVILGILLLSTSFLYSHFRRLIETWWKDDQTVV